MVCILLVYIFHVSSFGLEKYLLFENRCKFECLFEQIIVTECDNDASVYNILDLLELFAELLELFLGLFALEAEIERYIAFALNLNLSVKVLWGDEALRGDLVLEGNLQILFPNI